MQSMLASATPQKKPKTERNGPRGAAQESAAWRWLTPSGVLACHCCNRELIAVDVLRKRTEAFPPLPFWRADTRQLMVRCNSCKHFHMVFTYPLFNFIPPARLKTGMMILNAAVAAMVVWASAPH